jgi:TonB family protein
MIGFIVSLVAASSAQVISPGTNDKCVGKVYGAKEVALRARLIDFKSLTLPKEAQENAVSGQVIINAVLCRNGHVTDIAVVKGLPFGVTESAINTVRNTRFAPAELNFHSVSQATQFEFSVNEVGVSGLERIDPVKAAGRFVDELDIIGNRRLTKEEVLEWIKTRAGEVYKPDQVQKDLSAILASGYFNAQSTRVSVEDAPRGGVRVIFEVMELPLIAEIAFEGYKRDPAPILNELARQHVNVQWGRPLDPANLQKARKVIEDYFRSQGWINVKVEAFVDNLMVTEVKIRFLISGTNF